MFVKTSMVYLNDAEETPAAVETPNPPNNDNIENIENPREKPGNLS